MATKLSEILYEAYKNNLDYMAKLEKENAELKRFIREVLSDA